MNLKFGICGVNWLLFAFCSEIHFSMYLFYLGGRPVSLPPFFAYRSVCLQPFPERRVAFISSSQSPSSFFKSWNTCRLQWTSPAPTLQSSPPSSPGFSRLASRSSQQSQPQAPELPVPPARDNIPTVVIHPPEEDLEHWKVKIRRRRNNLTSLQATVPSPPCVVLLVSGSLALGMNACQHIAWAAYAVNAYDLTRLLHGFVLYTVLQKSKSYYLINYIETTEYYSWVKPCTFVRGQDNLESSRNRFLNFFLISKEWLFTCSLLITWKNTYVKRLTR